MPLCFCCLLALLVLTHAVLSPHVFGHLWLCAEHGISIIVNRNHLSPPSQFPFAFLRLLWVIATWVYLSLNLESEVFQVIQMTHSQAGVFLNIHLLLLHLFFEFAHSRVPAQSKDSLPGSQLLSCSPISLSKTHFSLLAVSSESANTIRPTALQCSVFLALGSCFCPSLNLVILLESCLLFKIWDFFPSLLSCLYWLKARQNYPVCH